MALPWIDYDCVTDDCVALRDQDWRRAARSGRTKLTTWADDVGLIVGVTLVLGTAVLFVMLPVLRGDWATMGPSDDEVTEVDARKQAALRGLRDAEYDYHSGKIDQEDYQLLKSDLARQALKAMEEQSPARHAAAKFAKGAAPHPEGER